MRANVAVVTMCPPSWQTTFMKHALQPSGHESYSCRTAYSSSLSFEDAVARADARPASTFTSGRLAFFSCVFNAPRSCDLMDCQRAMSGGSCCSTSLTAAVAWVLGATSASWNTFKSARYRVRVPPRVGASVPTPGRRPTPPTSACSFWSSAFTAASASPCAFFCKSLSCLRTSLACSTAGASVRSWL